MVKTQMGNKQHYQHQHYCKNCGSLKTYDVPYAYPIKKWLKNYRTECKYCGVWLE